MLQYCTVSEESTILTVCVDFDTSMNIRYRGLEASVKLTPIAKNFEFLIFQCKFLLLIEILKFQGAHRNK